MTRSLKPCSLRQKGGFCWDTRKLIQQGAEIKSRGWDEANPDELAISSLPKLASNEVFRYKTAPTRPTLKIGAYMIL